MIVEPTSNRYAAFHVCGNDCRDWTNWRSSIGGRQTWKAVCSVMLVSNCAWYLSAVLDSMTLLTIGTIFMLKLLTEIWGQDTPTWACPGGWQLFIVVYIVGIPSIVYLMGFCRVQDVDFPFREPVALALYLFGSAYSLSYEVHRFLWKARAENKGRLHTVGHARLCMHPNYFGDLFTYTGWALAVGTRCALSLGPAQLCYLIFLVIPNSDAYLARRYPSDFPAYAASTASLIPGVRSRPVSIVLAWAGLAASLYLQMSCMASCGMR